jgi:hypothetical protein
VAQLQAAIKKSLLIMRKRILEEVGAEDDN